MISFSTWSSARSSRTSRRGTAPSLQWEDVAAAIKAHDQSDDEVIALLKEFLIPRSTDAHEDEEGIGRRVDSVGCSNTDMWAALVHQEEL